MNIQASLEMAVPRLAARSQSAALDAQVLLAHILERSRSWIIAHPEYILPKDIEKRYEEVVRRFEEGAPLPYILGHWEFFDLDFLVTPDVLIPRPETEHMVEAGLEWLAKRAGQPTRVVDVGTGSGCIAICLAAHAKDVRVIAADVSLAALGVAHWNILRYDLSERVFLCQTDLILPFRGPFDLICANLPYGFGETVPAVARAEPLLAIDGGPDGLTLIRRLMEQAVTRLAPGGLMLMEIEETKGAEVNRIARNYFPCAQVVVQRDLAGRERLLRVEG